MCMFGDGIMNEMKPSSDQLRSAICGVMHENVTVIKREATKGQAQVNGPEVVFIRLHRKTKEAASGVSDILTDKNLRKSLGHWQFNFTLDVSVYPPIVAGSILSCVLLVGRR